MEVSGQIHVSVALSPEKYLPVVFVQGGWVGPRDIFDSLVKRKICFPCRESNGGFSILQPLPKIAVLGSTVPGISRFFVRLDSYRYVNLLVATIFS